MWDKINDFIFAHPFWTYIIGAVFMMLLGLAIWIPYSSYTRAQDLEAVKDAEYVLYQSNGEMKALDSEVIIDMDTGYQYRIFEINGQYVCAPAIDEDGTVYKTVE